MGKNRTSRIAPGRPHRQNGFTLIELMIVVAIVGILAAIAYPSYRDYVIETRRADAQGALMGLANAMERHYTENNTYRNASMGGGSDHTGEPSIFPTEAPLDGDDKFYDLSIISATATSYTIRATPKNDQAGDGFLQLDSTGARAWDENSDGDVGDANEDDWEVN